jgi:hypothetical protein
MNPPRTIDGIIANDYVATATAYSVTIAASDAGFQSGVDCGVWTRTSSVVTTATDQDHPQPAADIGRNRRLSLSQ